jgi:hypothetical protein
MTTQFNYLPELLLLFLLIKIMMSCNIEEQENLSPKNSIKVGWVEN